ncbi:MAG TPA: ABC transporter permease [Solirubrobacterales bacterium]|jgi:peptide/nickel transport system permease protein|nr:ABC transporter permease [Solirubrobacterales bacterium]
MSVARFVIGRLGILGITLLVASFLVFTALFLAYPDPIPFLTKGHAVTPQAEEALRAQYHLNDPFLARYVAWLGGVVQGDFGQSVQTREGVGGAIVERAGTTLLLLTYSGVLIGLLGLGSGILAGTAKGGLGTIARGATRIGLAIPTFVLGPALIAVFAVNLGWFPVFGSGSGLLDRLWHLTLPAIALAVTLAAYVGRVTTVAVWEEYDREHVETARARGIPESSILRRHVVRNALIPVTTATAVAVASLFSGAVVVESIFALDGLGSLLLESVLGGDFPMVQGIVLVIVAALVIINLALDLLYAALDPRVGAGG